MAGSGIFFAVDRDTAERLKKTDMAERPFFITKELDEVYFDEYPERTCELEDSWEAVHRALTDGSFCFDCADFPLGNAVLGGEVLYFDGKKYDDHIITLKTPEQAKSVFEGLAALDEKTFSKGYAKIPAEEYPDKSADDCEAAYEYLCDSVSFWRYAAEHGLYVLFTAEL
jgi:hypothetical protein